MADEQAQDAVSKEVQTAVDKEQAQGFRGTEVDQTPNEAYTVAGVLKDMPTPETAVTPESVRKGSAPLVGKDEKK